MVAVVMSALFCWTASWSIENPGIGNPVGPSTIPPSTISSGLVSNSAPINMDGNLLITGNVRRGRHFRGHVPYRSPTSFGSSLGSSALSSFLRDTAGPEDFQTYSNKYGTQPYYSPTETVTTMMPGRSGIFVPERTRADTRVEQDARSETVDAFRLDSITQRQTLFSQNITASASSLQRPETQYGPLAQSRLMLESRFPTSISQSQRGTELFTPAQIGISKQDKTSSAELFREQNVADRTQSSITFQGPGPRDGRWEKNESLRFPNEQMNNESLRPAFEMQTSGQNQDGDGKRNTLTCQGEVLERIRQQLDDLTKSLNAAMPGHDGYKDISTDSVAERREKPFGYQSNVPDSSRAIPEERIDSRGYLTNYEPQGAELTPTARRRLNRIDTNMRTDLDFTEMTDYTNSQKRNSPLDELDKLSQAEISAEANRIMGSHNSLESLSQSRFNQHMLDAEEHLRAGRYYHAASSFSLASVYQPDNPLALAGRGHALFAAGEYVSSALFLSRALAISPEYLQMRVDIVAMLGDERKLADRIADIEQWLARSGSSQLQFLLGYVYYRTGQFHRAKQAIDAAYEKTPQLPEVQAMKITLDNIIMRR